MPMSITSIKFNGVVGFQDDLDLVKLGKISTFVGPNSSGKTTALHLIRSVLLFLQQRSFDGPSKLGKDNWLYWESATIRFTGKFSELGGDGESSSVELQIAQRDTSIRITRITTDSMALQLNESTI